MVLDVAFLSRRGREGAPNFSCAVSAAGFSSHCCMTKIHEGEGGRGRNRRERRPPISLRGNSATTQFTSASDDSEPTGLEDFRQGKRTGDSRILPLTIMRLGIGRTSQPFVPQNHRPRSYLRLYIPDLNPIVDIPNSVQSSSDRRKPFQPPDADSYQARHRSTVVSSSLL